MTTDPKPRLPIRPGYFTVPEDPSSEAHLLGTRCRTCGEYFFPRRAVCAKCLSEDAEDCELSSEGILYSFTFVHFPLFGSMNMEHFGGYGVGQVDLPEGPRIQAPLAGTQAHFRVGQKLRLELEKLREDDMGRDVMIIRYRPID